MKKIGALIGAGAIAGGLMLSAPANAYPGFILPGPGVCNYPGVSGGAVVFGFGGTFCDYPPVLNGSHYHCEQGGGAMVQGVGGCSWRWPDNTPAPVPPAEQIMW